MNSTADKAEQRKQDQKPMFSHRFDQNRAGDTLAVVDAIGMMTERAHGILYMLFGHFEGKMRYTDETIKAAIGAAISEIDDIDDALRVHWAAIRPGKSPVDKAKAATNAGQSELFKEVQYWADNHLLASGNKYRLIDNATKEVLTEFEAESLDDAKEKCSIFLRSVAHGGEK